MPALNYQHDTDKALDLHKWLCRKFGVSLNTEIKQVAFSSVLMLAEWGNDRNYLVAGHTSYRINADYRMVGLVMEPQPEAPCGPIRAAHYKHTIYFCRDDSLIQRTARYY